MFEDYLVRWNLIPDGEPVHTSSSLLLPVLQQGSPAMLKMARHAEERRGGRLMAWWDGDGAARVLAHDGDALLLERAVGTSSLAEMARNGRDDEASRIICAAAARLHAPRQWPPPELVPLPQWFAALEPAVARHAGILRQSAAAARSLLERPQDPVVLHGDLHHGNVLDMSPRGWVAIDPKGLVGERGFDFANIFCNPDRHVATSPGRLARQAKIVAATAGLSRDRLLQWILAYAGLSAAWSLEDGDDPALALAVAETAAEELAGARP